MYPGRYTDTNTIDMPDNKTVWSSRQGDARKKEQRSVNAKSLPPQQQTIYLHRESSGRGGKAVTLVKNLTLSADDLKAQASSRRCEDTVLDGWNIRRGQCRWVLLTASH